MDRKIRIRFAGLAGLGAQNQSSIELLTGYTLEKDGDDWVVYDDDPAFSAPPVDALALHAEGIELSPSSFNDTAAECRRFLHSEIEEHGFKAPTELSVSSNLGLISELEQARQFYFWEKPNFLHESLIEKVLPRMVKLGATRVYPVLMNSRKFYARIALPKISYLNRHHGIESAKDKVLNERVLDSVLPSPIEPLNSLDALLFVSPYALAIPLHRVGSALLFTPKRTWEFPPILTSNIFDQMDSTSDLFCTNKLTYLFLGKDTSWRLTRQFIQLAVTSMNRLMYYFSHPLNFLGDNGEFDELRLLKAQSLLRLMIADVKAINMTNSHHTKSRLTFQFIDKAANLIVEMNQPSVGGKRQHAESQVANAFYLPNMFATVQSILGFHGRWIDRRLGDLLIRAISRAENSVTSDINAAFARAGKSRSDDAVVGYFRTLRNLGHGTFLNREQFEGLFLEMNPIIPSEYSYLPWMVLLALGLAPDRMLAASG